MFQHSFVDCSPDFYGRIDLCPKRKYRQYQRTCSVREEYEIGAPTRLYSNAILWNTKISIRHSTTLSSFLIAMGGIPRSNDDAVASFANRPKAPSITFGARPSVRDNGTARITTTQQFPSCTCGPHHIPATALKAVTRNKVS